MGCDGCGDPYCGDCAAREALEYHQFNKENPMSVRAKFKCISITSTMQSVAKKDEAGAYVKDEKGNQVYDNVELRTIKFSPVYGNGDPNHENTKFWNATPSGSLELGTINPAAWEMFKLGDEYYLDFLVAAKG